MAQSFDSRLLNLANSLSDYQKTELLRYLENLVGQVGFRIYPSILLIPKDTRRAERSEEPGSERETKLFRYSPSEDKYIPSKSKVVAKSTQIAAVSVGTYVLQEKDKLFLVKRGGKRVVLQEIIEFNLLPNGYYFVVFVNKKKPGEQKGKAGQVPSAGKESAERRELVDSNFKSVMEFEGELE